jgi:hypothetical protein
LPQLKKQNAPTTKLLSGIMPLTAAQMTAPFEQDDQMGIPHSTVMQLQQEGITIVDNLINNQVDCCKSMMTSRKDPRSLPRCCAKSDDLYPIICVWCKITKATWDGCPTPLLLQRRRPYNHSRKHSRGYIHEELCRTVEGLRGNIEGG